MKDVQKLSTTSFLRNLGVYGFDKLEPLILAALVSRDPLLLIGKSGTGKTYLLNRISKALQLNHRHYNASLVSFDDLIGFPYPAEDGKGIDFLPTPATIWGANSVLVDELSRCKAEVQNKFFSIIHEKNIQGMTLDQLIYRWAAMNPFHYEGDGDEEQYSGSQPLDPAPADRFGFIIEVPDWPALTGEDQEAVIHSQFTEGQMPDQNSLVEFIDEVRSRFLRALENPPAELVTYVRLVSGLLTEAGLRISPRRAQMLMRNILACESVLQFTDPDFSINNRFILYKKVLSASLPHRAFREQTPAHLVDSVHAEVARLMRSGSEKERWISEFLIKDDLPARIEMLFDPTVGKDIKSLGIIQMLERETLERKSVFAFSSYPALAELEMLNQEGLDDLLRIASGIMEVDGENNWRAVIDDKDPRPKQMIQCEKIAFKLPMDQNLRKLRARQLFFYLMSVDHYMEDPEDLEYELQRCFEKVRELLSTKMANHE